MFYFWVKQFSLFASDFVNRKTFQKMLNICSSLRTWATQTEPEEEFYYSRLQGELKRKREKGASMAYVLRYFSQYFTIFRLARSGPRELPKTFVLLSLPLFKWIFTCAWMYLPAQPLFFTYEHSCRALPEWLQGFYVLIFVVH